MTPQQYNLGRAAYSVQETLSQLGIGRTQLYALIASNRLRATKCGARTLILAADIAEFLDSLRAGAAE